MDDLLMEYEGNRPSTPTDRERRRRLAATITICGLAFVGIGQLSTGALFSDQGTANVQFATGNVQVSLAGPTGTTGGPRSLTLPNVSGMAPGDTSYVPLQVDNTGSLKLRYAVTGQTAAVGAAPDLADVLEYTVNSVGAAADCSAAGFAGGSLASVGSDLLLPAAETALVGSKATGNDTGDRTLLAGSNEWLCVRAALPINVGNPYANGKGDVTLTFYAEQTANNP